MTTARDIMNAGVTCVGEHETLTAAAQYMREHDIGALPICGDDAARHAHRPRHCDQRPGCGPRPEYRHGWRVGPGQHLLRRCERKHPGDAQRHGRTSGPPCSGHLRAPLGRNRHRSRHRPTPARARHCAVRQGNLLAHGPRQLATSDHPPARKALSASIGGTQCVMRSRLGGSPGLW